MRKDDYRKKLELSRNHGETDPDTYMYTSMSADEIIEKHRKNGCEVCKEEK